MTTEIICVAAFMEGATAASEVVVAGWPLAAVLGPAAAGDAVEGSVRRTNVKAATRTPATELTAAGACPPLSQRYPSGARGILVTDALQSSRSHMAELSVAVVRVCPAGIVTVNGTLPCSAHDRVPEKTSARDPTPPCRANDAVILARVLTIGYEIVDEPATTFPGSRIEAVTVYF